MIAEHDLEGLDQDVADLRSYLPQLGGLLLRPGQHAAGGGRRQKVSGSPAPWNAPVAHLITDVQAGARRHADVLDRWLGNTRQVRGAGDAGTLRALGRVAVNVRRIDEQPGAWSAYEGRMFDAASAAVRQVRGWAWRSRELLDQLRPGEERWTRAPAGLTCPNPFDPARPAAGECGRPLWLAPGWQHVDAPPVYCRRCIAEDGEPYAWPHAAWLLVVNGAA